MSATTVRRRAHVPSPQVRVAAALMPAVRAQSAEYREDCAADRARGYRPHYCRHGMNLHVDWDPICQGCEDGVTSDHQLALRWAGDMLDRYWQVHRAWAGLIRAGRWDDALLMGQYGEMLLDQAVEQARDISTNP